MVASFGANARVVEIIVGSSGIYYQVIGADRQLHIRDYSIVESEIEAGTYGYNRKTHNYVRALTPAQSRSAVLTLGQVDPGVVDSLYRKVGFPRQGSSATLTGRSWFLRVRRPARAPVRRGIQRRRAQTNPGRRATGPQHRDIPPSTPAKTPTSTNRP